MYQRLITLLSMTITAAGAERYISKSVCVTRQIPSRSSGTQAPFRRETVQPRSLSTSSLVGADCGRSLLGEEVMELFLVHHENRPARGLIPWGAHVLLHPGHLLAHEG